MAIHIRDPETDRLARKLAARRGIGLTEAVREAVRHELEREEEKLSLWERTAAIRARIASAPDTGLEADKDFYDWLSGEDDD